MPLVDAEGNPIDYTLGPMSGVAPRANIIAYLRSLSDSPAPLPEAGGDSAASSEGAAASTD